MRTLIAAIHGIMTGQTAASWPDRFDAWMWRRDPQVKVLKKEYRAGPFPRWNCLVKDGWLARGLANEMELLLGGPPGATAAQAQQENNFPPPWFVAHSNGAVIALLTTKRLLARGYQVGGLILTGAACEADIARNGVLDWFEHGRLGTAIAYSSDDDAVLAGDPRVAHTPLRRLWAAAWGRLLRPYGCLGRTGWMCHGVGCACECWRCVEETSPKRRGNAQFGRAMTGDPLPAGRRRHRRLAAPAASVLPGTCLRTRWFAGGHGVYFAPEHRTETFELLWQDILTHEAAIRHSSFVISPPHSELSTPNS
jgi:hypothetical protein